MAKTGPPVKTDGPVYFVTASYIPELLPYTTPTRGIDTSRPASSSAMGALPLGQFGG